MPPTCSTRIHFTHDRAVIALEGELDVASASALELVVETVAGPVPHLVLDLERLRFMDTFGYDVLRRCTDEARARTTRIELRNVRGEPALLIETHRARSKERELLAQDDETRRAAVLSRATIEQAVSVLVATSGCGRDAAFEHLRQQSQLQNEKLRDVASALVVQHEGRQRVS